MTGQLIKRSENTWLVRIFFGRDADGKRKYFNKTIHGTKKDAQKYLTAKTREKDLGIFVEPASIYLGEFLDRWLQEVAKNKLRARTFDNYESLLNCHVRKFLGAKKLSDIQAYEVQKLYNDMKKANYSPKTIRHVHNVLSPAFKQAIKWKMLTQNPCDLCELPQMEKTEMMYFTPQETAKFLDAAKDDKYFSVFIVAIETGMRPEEYLGLQWKDVDFDNDSLSVRRALVVKKGGGFIFTNRKKRKVVEAFQFQTR